MNYYCQIWLTCADKDEACRITNELLRQKLIVCARQMPVASDFLWQGKVDHNDEILIMMESREDFFERIEKVVAEMHSYETFVLTATPVQKISKEAEKWLEKSIG